MPKSGIPSYDTYNILIVYLSLLFLGVIQLLSVKPEAVTIWLNTSLLFAIISVLINAIMSSTYGVRNKLNFGNFEYESFRKKYLTHIPGLYFCASLFFILLHFLNFPQYNFEPSDIIITSFIFFIVLLRVGYFLKSKKK